jgi:hypothetical protein
VKLLAAGVVAFIAFPGTLTALASGLAYLWSGSRDLATPVSEWAVPATVACLIAVVAVSALAWASWR